MDLLGKAKAYVAGKVAEMPMPEASINDVDFKSITLKNVTYQAEVFVMNPYAVPIPICDISYVLKSNARVIASGSVPDPGSLKRNDTTKLEVAAMVPHSLLVSLARDIGRDWDIDFEIEIGLTIDLPLIGNFTIPLSQKGEIKLPTFSDLWGSTKTDSDTT